MKNTLINNGWENENSSLFYRKEKGVEGKYVYYNAVFKFSLTKQKSGKYAYRGSVRVLNNKGRILKQKNRLFDVQPKKEQKNIKESIYSNSLEENEIKELIKKKVEKMYSKYYTRITEHIKYSVNSENVSPYQAFQIHGDEFISRIHKDSSQERRDKIKKMVNRCCSTLPEKPMIKFSRTEIKKWKKEYSIKEFPYKLMYNFWQFCIDNGICYGINPLFAEKRRKRKSLEAEQTKALKRNSLDSDEEDRFYKTLESQKSNITAAVSLLANKFDSKYICEMKCKDFVIKNKRDNFVIIKIYNTNTSTATKIQNKPLTPRIAKFVIKRLEALEEKYGKENIAEMYLIHLNGKPDKKYSPKRIIQEANRILQLSDVEQAKIEEARKNNNIASAKTLLHNTYRNNIYEKCNLIEDQGTAKFLLGESLGADKTSDNYTAFTSPSGEKRLFNILKILDEKRYLKNTIKDINIENNIIKIRKPDSNKEILQCEISVSLKPGEQIELSCPHGLYGEVITD